MGIDRRLSDRSTLRVREIENEYNTERNRKAVRFVASQSIDAIDCAELLAMLGLKAEDGKGEPANR